MLAAQYEYPYVEQHAYVEQHQWAESVMHSGTNKTRPARPGKGRQHHTPTSGQARGGSQNKGKTEKDQILIHRLRMAAGLLVHRGLGERLRYDKDIGSTRKPQVAVIASCLRAQPMKAAFCGKK